MEQLIGILAGFPFGSAAILQNACLLPLYPGLIAFLAGNAGNERARAASAWLGVLVLAGILTAMLGIGVVMALLSATFDSIAWLLPLIYFFVIGMGLLLMSGRNPFATLQTAQAPMLHNPYLTAYVYGLFFGPMTLPCTAPGLVAGLAYGAGAGGALSTLGFYFFFGLGFGWPLVLLPLLAVPFQRRIIGWLTKHHEALNRASGVLLIAVGIFGLMTELLPQIATDFVFETPMQLAYWGVVALIALMVGLLAVQQTQKRKRDTAA